MNPLLNLAPRHFPARIAELGFSVDLPGDWINHPLPDDDLDFSDPGVFVPLAVVTAPHAAIVFSVAARPAHAEGTLHDWAWYHLHQQGLQPQAVGPAVASRVAAVSGQAGQASDLGPMRVNFAFLEDGGRLLQFGLMAPELLADSVRDAWFAALRSLQLETPRGSRFAIDPRAEVAPAAAIPDPWLTPQPPAAPELRAIDEAPETDVETAIVPDESQGLASAAATAPPAPPPPPAPQDGPPAWWHEALAMDLAGRVDEAEAHIRAQCPTIGFASATADLHRLRMLRLQAAGDAAGAAEAYSRSSDFIHFYASLATSGGEGAALSLQRDRFLAELRSQYRGTP